MASEAEKRVKIYRCCLFLHSGSYDRVYQGLSIANIVLAKGGEVHILFSYGALKRLVKGDTDKIVIEGEPAPFKGEIVKHVKRGTMSTISELLDMGRRFGRLTIYACSGSMAALNISRDELIEDVDSATGMVSFLDIAMGADMTLYI